MDDQHVFPDEDLERVAEPPAVLSRDELLVERLAAAPYDMPGVGRLVLRPLSRAEVLDLNTQRAKLGLARAEALSISMALVEPKLTVDDVLAWQARSPAGEMEPLSTEVMRRSGMAPGQPKETMRQFRDDA